MSASNGTGAALTPLRALPARPHPRTGAKRASGTAAIVPVGLTTREFATIARYTDTRGVTVADFLRAAALATVQGER